MTVAGRTLDINQPLPAVTWKQHDSSAVDALVVFRCCSKCAQLANSKAKATAVKEEPGPPTPLPRDLQKPAALRSVCKWCSEKALEQLARVNGLVKLGFWFIVDRAR